MKNLSKILMLALVLAGTVSCGCTKDDGREVPAPENFVRYASDMSMSSSILERNIKFDILLPASYSSEPSKSYPVVYLLHGYGDKPSSWNDKWLDVGGKIKSLEAAGMQDMIYVFPEGFKNYYVNRYDGGFNYMDMFVKEFVPYIDKTYRTIADKGHRAITGYSMGGFGAMVLAMEHPDLFVASAPLSMSFRTDAQYMTESASGWDSQWGRLFGGQGMYGEARLTEYYKSLCPFYRFTEENKAELEKVHWYLTCGDDEEQLLIANDSLHVLMRDRSFKHEFRVSDGAHTGSYWRSALEEVLPMFAHYFSGGKDWTRTLVEAEAPSIETGEDGCFRSEKYEAASSGSIWLFHCGLPEMSVKKSMAVLQRPRKGNFIIIPCDLSVKPYEQWREQYAAVAAVSSSAVAVGDAGAVVLDHQEDFPRIALLDATVPEGFAVDKSRTYFILNTDDGVNYTASFQLYKACKKAGATFQYRVRNDADTPENTLLQGMETMKSFILL